ncbi:MAG: hypothetical protein EP319_07640 [Deltaproteobacteria bacterium]|nr:MAG: hypothetical protein EP319_07640 [Deltaproteobacteria bacterium]
MEMLGILVIHWYLSLFCQSFFLHRYCSHKMFEMNPLWERFFYFLTYLTQGASFLNPTSYSIMHQRHHAFSDTEKDPHSPHQSSNIKEMMLKTYNEYKTLLESETPYEIDTEVLKNKSPKWKALDDFAKSWPSIILWGLLYILLYVAMNPEPIWYFLIPLHFMVGPIQGAIVNWFGHKLGYRNYHIKDQSKNTLPLDFALMGELYQNNHHRFSQRMNFAHRWFEIDFTYEIARILNALGIIRMKDIPTGGFHKVKALLFVLFISFSIKTAVAQERQMIGTALLEYSIFKIDIYQISYFKGPNGVEELELDYKTNVKREYSQEGWKVGLEPIIKAKDLKPEQIKWIYDNTVDLAKGDKLIIRKDKNQVTLLKNGQPVAEIKDDLIASLIHYPWLGDRPIDEKLKSKLLGKSGT